MSEQDYDKQEDFAAKKYAKNWTWPRLPEAEMHALVGAFLAGVKWARENPPPEVLELVELLDGHNCTRPFSCVACDTLARFKNRGK